MAEWQSRDQTVPLPGLSFCLCGELWDWKEKWLEDCDLVYDVDYSPVMFCLKCMSIKDKKERVNEKAKKQKEDIKKRNKEVKQKIKKLQIKLKKLEDN